MKTYMKPELEFLRLTAACIFTASGDPDEWETDIVTPEDDYNADSDDT